LLGPFSNNHAIQMKKIFALFLFTIVLLSVHSQELKLPLYSGSIPNAKGTTNTEYIERGDYKLFKKVSHPDISVFLPTRLLANGQAVVICPGGGYVQLSMDLEGTDIAAYLNSIGVAAIVLKYRLPSAETNIYPAKAPLMDAHRAMRLVRANATKWNINPNQIGVIGFSAGGHLASTLGTHFDYGDKNSKDSIEKISCRPDFMILGYPVVSFADTTVRTQTRKMLMGEKLTNDNIQEYSNELHVTKDTPPTFFIHADNDKGVQTANSILMYRTLRKNGIPAELHIISEGGHGFGLGSNNKHVNAWTVSLKLWLESLRN
jgi:acetyl esterase/lipase